MMTPEGRILAHLKRTAKEIGLRVVRLHMGAGTEAGWPDVLVLGPVGAPHPLTLWVETKAPGKPLRAIQKVRENEIRSRGGLYAKVDSTGDARTTLCWFAGLCLYPRDEKVA